MKSLGDVSGCEHCGEDLHPEVSLLWDKPESIARRALRCKEQDEEWDALKEMHQREAVEWRARLIAQRDPIKCATPIDQDALTREQQKIKRG